VSIEDNAVADNAVASLEDKRDNAVADNRSRRENSHEEEAWYLDRGYPDPAAGRRGDGRLRRNCRT
jgi:hypothetical protein